MRKTAFCFLLMVMVGCATSYHKKGTGLLSSGCGYRDSYIGNDVYLITVEANEYTTPATVYEYFHRRAREVTKENGYDGYKVIEFIPSEKQKLNYYPDWKFSYKEKPSASGRIKCYKKNQNGNQDAKS